MFFLKHLLEAL